MLLQGNNSLVASVGSCYIVTCDSRLAPHGSCHLDENGHVAYHGTDLADDCAAAGAGANSHGACSAGPSARPASPGGPAECLHSMISGIPTFAYVLMHVCENICP